MRGVKSNAPMEERIAHLKKRLELIQEVGENQGKWEIRIADDDHGHLALRFFDADGNHIADTPPWPINYVLCFAEGFRIAGVLNGIEALGEAGEYQDNDNDDQTGVML